MWELNSFLWRVRFPTIEMLHLTTRRRTRNLGNYLVLFFKKATGKLGEAV